MERLSEHDEPKCRLLSQISQCEENVESIYEDVYKLSYGCLTPSLPIQPIQPPKPNKFDIRSIGFIMLVLLFITILLIIVNTDVWHSIEYLYIKTMFASYHMIY